jgi:TatD DNase family protein
MFVDSHCHLSSPELIARLPEIRAAMRAAHVDKALCICTTLDEFRALFTPWRSATTIFGAASASIPTRKDSREPTVEGLVSLAALPKVVAIGETGLDYYRMGDRSVADMAWQRDRFRVHVRAGASERQASRRPHPKCIARHARRPARRAG